jgi:tRNA pseudouridine38-40 synthase
MAVMAVRNIKLTISYDGLNYSGWQYQHGKRTIQGELQQAIGELTGAFTQVKGASRTDAGVSALGQVANFLIDSPIPTENFVKALNHRLPRDIIVTEAVEAEQAFEASSLAKSKLYRYTIFTGKNPNVLKTRNCWHRPWKLDAAAMDTAAKMLVGRHDFKSFASAGDKRENTTRTIFRCDVTAEDKWVNIEMEGDGFLHNMVRNIVGTLVEIGRGRWEPQKMNQIIEAKDRTTAGPIAPAAGLCLIWIKY